MKVGKIVIPRAIRDLSKRRGGPGPGMGWKRGKNRPTRVRQVSPGWNHLLWWCREKSSWATALVRIQDMGSPQLRSHTRFHKKHRTLPPLRLGRARIIGVGQQHTVQRGVWRRRSWVLVVCILPVRWLIVGWLHGDNACVIGWMGSVDETTRHITCAPKRGLVIRRCWYIRKHLVARGADIIRRQAVVNTQLHGCWATTR